MIKYRTSEWYKARIGKFTASCFGDLMAKPADKNAAWSKSALNCIEEAAVQLYQNRYEERPDSDSTRWGIKYEDQAIREFGIKTGFKIVDTGFVLHPNISDVGATPDTIIVENQFNNNLVIAQIKCPYNPNIHLDYLKKNK